MRPSTLSFARHIPMIKFVGGRHPRPEEVLSTEVKPHPMSAGLIPGGEGTLQISALNWPKHEKPKPQPPKKSTPTQPTSDKPYDFVSVLDLPKRFQTPLLDELEMEAVNGGGAGYML